MINIIYFFNFIKRGRINKNGDLYFYYFCCIMAKKGIKLYER